VQKSRSWRRLYFIIGPAERGCESAKELLSQRKISNHDHDLKKEPIGGEEILKIIAGKKELYLRREFATALRTEEGHSIYNKRFGPIVGCAVTCVALPVAPQSSGLRSLRRH